MNPLAPALATLALIFTPFLQRAEANTIDLPQYGFEIDALDAAPGEQMTLVLAMSLPASGGFSPNINVMVQPYSGSIKDYAALSKGQFEQMHATMIAEQQKGESEWSFEYTMDYNKKTQHCYSRAISKGGKVYLVTATANPSQWPSVEAKLRKHVDSLKLK